MSTIEEIMPNLYKELHANGAFLGRTWCNHISRFNRFLADAPGGDSVPILDYGCGPAAGLLSAYPSGSVIPYDPYVPKFSAPPWSGAPRTFFSCDVLEHMTLLQLRALVSKICKCKSITRVFLAVSTRAANKVMSNGMNAHLTVRTPDWWYGFFAYALLQHFTCSIAEVGLLNSDCVFGFWRNTEAPCVSTTSTPSAIP